MVMNDKEAQTKVQLFLARYLTFKFASECTSLMLKSKGDVSDIAGAYLFLASNALELYGKSFMCLRWEKQDKLDIEEINKRVSMFGHELDRIYHYQGVGDNFLQKAGIKKVTLIRQKRDRNNLNHYYFEFHINKDIVRVYPVESLRYGELTPKKNDILIIEETKLLNLCNSVRDALLDEAKEFLTVVPRSVEMIK